MVVSPIKVMIFVYNFDKQKYPEKVMIVWLWKFCGQHQTQYQNVFVAMLKSEVMARNIISSKQFYIDIWTTVKNMLRFKYAFLYDILGLVSHGIQFNHSIASTFNGCFNYSVHENLLFAT